MDYKIEDLKFETNDGSAYWDALFILCERYYTVSRLEEAEAMAFELRMLNPMDVRVYKLSAAIQVAKGNYLYARGAYQAALEIAPNDGEVCIGMAMACIHTDCLKEAMQYLDKTIQIAADDHELLDHAKRVKNLIQ